MVSSETSTSSIRPMVGRYTCSRAIRTSGGCRPDGGLLQQVTTFPESGLFLEEPTISPDGRWLVYNKGGGGASLWMLTIESDAGPSTALGTSPSTASGDAR